MTGYVYCAHACCLAIIIGKPGSVCDDCKACDPEPATYSCDGCDNDSDVTVPPQPQVESHK